MPVPPSSLYLYKKEEIIPSLCKLIMENFHIERWVFKIDDEYKGRGIAYFDMSSVKGLVELKKTVGDMYEDQVFVELQSILAISLKKNLRFVYNQLYKSYSEYIDEFLRHGGVIQAAPSCSMKYNSSPGISFLIEPDGF